MNLVKLINQLEEVRAEYGNLPEIYIHLSFSGYPERSFMEELSGIEVEERRALFLMTAGQLEETVPEPALALVELVEDQHELLAELLKERSYSPEKKEMMKKAARIRAGAARIKASLELVPRLRPVSYPEKIRLGPELNDRASLLRRVWQEVTEKAPDIMEDMKEGWMTELETIYWVLGYHEHQAEDMARAAFGEEPIDRDA